MLNFKKSSIILTIGFALIFLTSCENMPGADAKKYPPNPDLRVKKIIEIIQT